MHLLSQPSHLRSIVPSYPQDLPDAVRCFKYGTLGSTLLWIQPWNTQNTLCHRKLNIVHLLHCKMWQLSFSPGARYNVRLECHSRKFQFADYPTDISCKNAALAFLRESEKILEKFDSFSKKATCLTNKTCTQRVNLCIHTYTYTHTYIHTSIHPSTHPSIHPSMHTYRRA